MLHLDHLTVIAPSLAEGVEHIRECLDLDIPYGGTHPEMGTHNHVLRLGEDVYLEVIAVDPDAPAPLSLRWFGLSDQKSIRTDWENGRRLRGWVARTDHIDAVLSSHGELFGQKTKISRGGKYSQFSLPPDFNLPLGGILPSVIDRGGRTSPAGRMEDLGAQLCDFVLEHPNPAAIQALYEKVEIDNPPRLNEAPQVRYWAKIKTKHLEKTLD